MREQYFASCRVWAGIAWLLASMLLISAWAVMLAEDFWKLAFLLGGSALFMSAIAATLHMRSFMVRTCSLIRVANDMEVAVPEGDMGLRPVH